MNIGTFSYGKRKTNYDCIAYSTSFGLVYLKTETNVFCEIFSNRNQSYNKLHFRVVGATILLLCI